MFGPQFTSRCFVRTFILRLLSLHGCKMHSQLVFLLQHIMCQMTHCIICTILHSRQHDAAMRASNSLGLVVKCVCCHLQFSDVFLLVSHNICSTNYVFLKFKLFNQIFNPTAPDQTSAYLIRMSTHAQISIRCMMLLEATDLCINLTGQYDNCPLFEWLM